MQRHKLISVLLLIALLAVLLPASAVAQDSTPPEKQDDAVIEVDALKGLDTAAPVAAPVAAPAGGPAVVPPPGCVASPFAFSNNTPVAIPDGASPPAVSTIVVSGAGAYLLDVDLTTFIVHTWNSDLDFTLQSPQGTIVTISTDNGGSFDNVFNGTLWDDDANPAGQVPYTANNGLVTDHTYVNLVTATPLVPEEALGAFVGENPNGTWTLTVDDDLGGDIGAINSWSLNLATLPAAPATLAPVNFSNNTPVAIPDGASPPAVSTIVVSGAGAYLLDVDATTAIVHTSSSDLDFTLQSPQGTVVTVSTDNGGSFDNVFNGTLWDDDANPAGQVPYTSNNGLATDHTYVNLVTATPLAVEEALAAFIGENPNGTWTLTVDDDLTSNTGTLNSWSLAITPSSGCGVTAIDDTAVSYGYHIFIDVLANDAGGVAPLTVNSVTQGAHGKVLNYVTKVVYIPNRGYTGSDSFTYTAKDAIGAVSAPATVNVMVY